MGWFWCKRTTGDGLCHWRKRYYGLWTHILARSDQSLNALMMDLFLTNTQLLASQDINWWTGVVWIIVMFLSAVWILILTAPIHCRGSIGDKWWNATFLQICSDEETNSSTFGLSTFLANLPFCVNYFFNVQLKHALLTKSSQIYRRYLIDSVELIAAGFQIARCCCLTVDHNSLSSHPQEAGYAHDKLLSDNFSR